MNKLFKFFLIIFILLLSMCSEKPKFNKKKFNFNTLEVISVVVDFRGHIHFSKSYISKAYENCKRFDYFLPLKNIMDLFL